MRVLMNNYAVNSQYTNKKPAPGFQKGPMLIIPTTLGNKDNFVRDIGALYKKSEGNDRIIIVGEMYKQLCKLYTEIQPGFAGTTRPIEAVQSDIGLYKQALGSFVQAG